MRRVVQLLKALGNHNRELAIQTKQLVRFLSLIHPLEFFHTARWKVWCAWYSEASTGNFSMTSTRGWSTGLPVGGSLQNSRLSRPNSGTPNLSNNALIDEDPKGQDMFVNFRLSPSSSSTVPWLLEPNFMMEEKDLTAWSSNTLFDFPATVHSAASLVKPGMLFQHGLKCVAPRFATSINIHKPNWCRMLSRKARPNIQIFYTWVCLKIGSHPLLWLIIHFLQKPRLSENGGPPSHHWFNTNID